MNNIEDFIKSENKYYQQNIKKRSLFLLLEQIYEYYRFLEIIMARLEENSLLYGERIISKSGFNLELSTKIFLDIESYYIFIKILLDKTALFIEHYFGQENGLPVYSQRKLQENITSYIEKKHIDIPNELIKKANELGDIVLPYRDKQIEHQRNPMKLRGTIYDPGTNSIRILSAWATEFDLIRSENEKECKDVKEIQKLLDVYLLLVFGLIKTNRDKGKLLRFND